MGENLTWRAGTNNHSERLFLKEKMQIKKENVSLINKNHMPIPWHSFAGENDSTPVKEASLTEKSTVVGRIGFMLLSCGTGAWRVRSSMNAVARELGITCAADIGLVSIEYTCIDGGESYTQAMTLKNTGVNTSKLAGIETFVSDFPEKYSHLPVDEVHRILDAKDKAKDSYRPVSLGLAAGFACSAFTFLLGGGPVEMLCALFGAFIGNWLRVVLIRRRFTLVFHVAVSVAAACLIYSGLFQFLVLTAGVSVQHEAGYICSMLFIIPGFPFITSGIDLAKLDMRSGLERLFYAFGIILVAALVAWIMALTLKLKPMDFIPLGLDPADLLIFRLAASFIGVFGFSIMFNSHYRMAAAAGVIGAVANTLRLELVDLFAIPPAASAFVCVFLAGILASLMKPSSGYPRISITVPSIVIMVPGLYLYKAIYNMGIGAIPDAAHWFTDAILIMIALPLGLIFARILTDKEFRYSI